MQRVRPGEWGDCAHEAFPRLQSPQRQQQCRPPGRLLPSPCHTWFSIWPEGWGRRCRASTFRFLKRGRPPLPIRTTPPPTHSLPALAWCKEHGLRLSSIHAHLLAPETSPRKADWCPQAHQPETPLYSRLPQKNWGPAARQVSPSCSGS
ncbi:hypothetical protein HJG60_011800 [Phyllostomus discolor]|uniref:Uncharacterized protein n=1 Tax=Phyllostomus discolor TaxID=89673 RepID=A0A834DSP9_9CHIR|nr:hypothetical protein HJG60_011800 [Phyllostomus discolor]